MSLKKMLVLSIVIGVIATMFPACNTLRGAGKDIQRVGEKIQEWTH